MLPSIVQPPCEVRWLGTVDYHAAWELQQRLAIQRRAGEIPDTLLLLEHPPTLTLGRAAHTEHILATAEQLSKLGITVVETDRGGDVTYHGPGQLVGYPILSLQDAPHTADLHLYLRKLEETIIRSLAQFEIAADRFQNHTGVWTGCETTNPAKIAAIGIKATRWITQHGFALNVCPDMTHFDLIVPCGIHDYGVTSMERLLSRPIKVGDITPIVAAAFCREFSLVASASSASEL